MVRLETANRPGPHDVGCRREMAPTDIDHPTHIRRHSSIVLRLVSSDIPRLSLVRWTTGSGKDLDLVPAGILGGVQRSVGTRI